MIPLLKIEKSGLSIIGESYTVLGPASKCVKSITPRASVCGVWELKSLSPDFDRRVSELFVFALGLIGSFEREHQDSIVAQGLTKNREVPFFSSWEELRDHSKILPI